jgi:hypothetical protein
MMYVLVNEHSIEGGIAVLDHGGVFVELEEAIQARDNRRKEHANPEICVYQLVKTPEDQEAGEGWDNEPEGDDDPKQPPPNRTDEAMANEEFLNMLKNM